MERGSGSSGRACEPPPPSEVAGRRGPGPSRAHRPCSRGVPEPALKVLSSARAVGEVTESICILAGTWEGWQRGVFAVGVGSSGEASEGGQVWGRAARLRELAAQQKGLHEQNRELMYFSVAIQIK